MASINESSHAKNVANLNTLIMVCESREGKYNPSNPNLSIVNMKRLYTSADDAVLAVNNMLPPFKSATNAREIVFKPVSGLATKLYNYVVSTGIAKQTQNDLLTIKRKLQGTRANRKLTDEEKAAFKAEGKEVRESSSSQRSFDSQINHFDMLIKTAGAIPVYKPNEEELKIETLNKKLAAMRNSNNAAVNALNPLQATRNERNTLLYAAGTGLVDVALAAKAYVKSVDTVKGSWYKQISKLKFSRQ